MFLHRFLLRGADLFGIGFDLLQVRRPFNLDRHRRRVTGTGRRRGLRSRFLSRLEFPHRFLLVRRGRRRRFVGRRVDLLRGFGNCGRGRMMRAFCVRKRCYGKLSRWALVLARRLLWAMVLLTAAFALALLVPVAATAAPPSAASLALLALLARLLLALGRPAGVGPGSIELRLRRALLLALALVVLAAARVRARLPVAFLPVLTVAVPAAIALPVLLISIRPLTLPAMLRPFLLAVAAATVAFRPATASLLLAALGCGLRRFAARLGGLWLALE